MARTLRIPTPGDILKLDFLDPMGVTPDSLSRAIDVPADHIDGIIKDGLAITTDTARRLSDFFGTSTELWLNLQAQYDADIAKDGRAFE